jgi:hypothetical protein
MTGLCIVYTYFRIHSFYQVLRLAGKLPYERGDAADIPITSVRPLYVEKVTTQKHFVNSVTQNKTVTHCNFVGVALGGS